MNHDSDGAMDRQHNVSVSDEQSIYPDGQALWRAFEEGYVPPSCRRNFLEGNIVPPVCEGRVFPTVPEVHIDDGDKTSVTSIDDVDFYGNDMVFYSSKAPPPSPASSVPSSPSPTPSPTRSRMDVLIWVLLMFMGRCP